MKQKECLLGIFVYNEGERFKALLDNPALQPPRQFDLLVIDDGSQDGASDQCRMRGVNVIQNPENLGIGKSIRIFLRYARQKGYKTVVIMAGNGKMLPEEVTRFLHALDDGWDYVQGSRFLEGFRSPNLPLFRRFVIRFGTPLCSLFLNNRYTDITCGFRAYRLDPLFTDGAIEIEQSWLDRYEMEYYIHYKFDQGGYRIKEVPCTMSYPQNSKNYSKIKPIVGWWSMLRPWLFLILGVKK